MAKIITVEKKDAGKRIDLFMLEQDLTMTRTSVKKVIMEGLIKVNNVEVRPNYHVKENDKVSIEVKQSKQFIEDTNSTELTPVKMNLDIIYEDKNIILINKPAGLVVHPVYAHKEDTLLNGLVYYFQNKGENVKVRPVHRLDKETSGVILFAKTKDSNEFYSKLFESHAIEKTYYAVVQGDFKSYMVRKNRPDIFEYFTYISKDKTIERAYFNTSKEKGLPARTRIFFVDYWVRKDDTQKYSLVKLQPLTGRTHQLRVHISSLGFPILGDLIYSKKPYKRMMLHAYSLKIPVDGKEVEFTAKLPEEFNYSF